ncbi:glutaredoxin [Halalkaliarchaeum desulfuricum]|uniref:Glutaredoxin n=1 Tax=Halalkaliarchaeum desulfuricum TaxID=2055893 RepID=A0A343TJ65_9EURY|nr:glutaredoxin family protein [Halalkaliarchaeum desulfuricum]AUX09137.1 glutaredoxin [Halalkaliarchaeum desulfuricum]
MGNRDDVTGNAETGDVEGVPVDVTVYSREDCHLCDEAIEVIRQVAADVGVIVAIDEIDVDEDEQLKDEYGDRVPYVLVDGDPAYKYRVDSFDLRRRLRDRAQN